jgi:hypothetical protein
MRMSKVLVVLMLAGLVTEASAQTVSPIQMAQADQSGQGTRPGGGQGNSGSGERHHGPPPEAVAACQDKTSGAACSFTGRQNEKLNGTCFSPPAREPGASGASGQGSSGHAERPLACRPDRGGAGGGRGPGG